MNHHSTVSICPDCGGILQPTGLDALTSAEVAASEAAEPDRARQCLLCGYTETPQGDITPEPC